MANRMMIHLGIAPRFLRELEGLSKPDQDALIEQRLHLHEPDTSKMERFGILGGTVEAASEVTALEHRPEVEWVEPVGMKQAI